MKPNSTTESMIEAAYAGGKLLVLLFNNPPKEMSKGDTYYDVVSEADTESEEAILKILTTKFPTINILSEEKGFIDKSSTDTIIIDPLDGSSNFLLGLPHFSVALAHIHAGKIVASVVYNPVLDKMYFAEKGKGTFLNNKKLEFKPKKESSYTAVNFSHKASWKEKRKFFDHAYGSGISRVMNNWSPNLDFCLLAEGKIDAVVSCNSLIYDFAPGFLIAQESGCIESPDLKEIDVHKDSSMSFIISNSQSLLEKLDRVL